MDKQNELSNSSTLSRTDKMHISTNRTVRFGVIVYNGVEPIDIGGTVGVVSMARRVLPNIEAVVIAAKTGAVTLASDLTIVVPCDFDDAPPCDVFIVCGGPGWRAEVKNEQMLSFLRRQRPETLASVCTGALILAAAGVLDGRSATTRRAAVGNEDNAPLRLLETYAHRIEPREAVVVDSGIVTGGGVSLAIDTTLYLIGKFYGENARDEVARLIEYDRAYAANDAALGTFEIGTAFRRP
jgi:transcriptional regulator GlxA family with amidase domain